MEKLSAPDTVMIQYYWDMAQFNAREKAFDNSIKYYDTIVNNYKRKVEYKFIGKTLERKASVLRAKGEGDVGISIMLDLLAHYEDEDNLSEASRINNKIGVLFLKMGEYKDAQYHLEESIKQAQSVSDSEQEASGLMSLGNRWKKEKVFDKAEENYLRSIEICEENDYKRLLAGNYNNYGSLQRMMDNLERAEEYYNLAVEVNKEIGNDLWLSYNYNNLGNIYDQRGEYKIALGYYERSSEIKDKLGDDPGKLITLLNISEAYESLKDYNQAYRYHVEYSQLKDSLDEQSRLEQTKELAAQFQAEKREAEIVQLSMQDEMSQKEIAAQRRLLWLLGVGILLVLVLLLWIWKSAKQRKEANLILEEKNAEIDEKNTEIIDSINYAKRIQSSMLPSEEALSNRIGDVGLIYKPKDIISGDFYICEEMKDRVYFSIIDCTGHGVPGAMVSVVAYSAFNKAVYEMNISDPKEILEQLNVDIPRALSHEGGVQDGMDMALCCYEREKGILTFSGANQNCWIYNPEEKVSERARADEKIRIYQKAGVELLVAKGSRKGIGASNARDKFTSMKFDVKPGDRVLLSTDGFQDQFGGPGNKKFMVKQLRDIVLENGHLKTKNLKDVLTLRLSEWQGDLQQIDDICLMIAELK
jgi:tetratricopeptide (TPR) repeat protein